MTTAPTTIRMLIERVSDTHTSDPEVATGVVGAEDGPQKAAQGMFVVSIASGS
jgi:hypothetical protein